MKPQLFTYKKFILATIAWVILTYAIIFNSSIISYGQENNTVYDKQQNLNVYLLSKVFEKEIERISDMVELVDNFPEFQVLDYNNVSQHYMSLYHGIPENEELNKRSVFKSIMDIYPSVAGLFFLLPNGDMYVEEPYSYQLNLTKTNFSFRDYYHGALDSGKMYMDDVIISAASGIPITVVAVPVYAQNSSNTDKTFGNNNTLIGLLGVDVNFRTFDEFLKSLPLGSDERVVFLDTIGNKIADSSKSNINNQTSLHFSGLSSFNNALKGKSGNIVEKFGKTKMEISYAPVKSIQNTWVLLWLKQYTNNL